MNLRRIALGLFLGLGIVSVALPAAAVFCVHMTAPGVFPPACLEWGPSTPSGWTPTGGDNNAYPGEIVMCSGQNLTGHCFYRYTSPGTTTSVPNLGDMNSATESSTPVGFRVRSAKVNTASGATWYTGEGYGGTTLNQVSGFTYSNEFNSYSANSLKVFN